MSASSAKFGVGHLVRHRLFGYRGVVYDVDPDFQLTDEWYESVARSRPPKDLPWYRVLPDDTEHTTYVAERNLVDDESGDPIRHPLVATFFRGMEDKVYCSRRTEH